MYHPTRGGVRGGKDQFKWEDVKTDKDRECYLGHSLMAPVGRWQDGKDLTWYAKEGKDDADNAKSEEFSKAKELEEKALMAALGYKVFDKPKKEDHTDERREEESRLSKQKDKYDDEPSRHNVKGPQASFVSDKKDTKELDSLLISLYKKYGRDELFAALKSSSSKKKKKHSKSKKKKSKRDTSSSSSDSSDESEHMSKKKKSSSNEKNKKKTRRASSRTSSEASSSD